MPATEMTQPALIDESVFSGRIHIDGEWIVGEGGEADSIEPATGRTLAKVGLASPGDVARAAEGAARAQAEWAATPHPVRAAVMRRAAQLWEQHAEEIMGWNVREVGAVPALAGFALHVTAAECYEASALPSAPLGSILSSEEPRLSLAICQAYNNWLAEFCSHYPDRHIGLACLPYGDIEAAFETLALQHRR